MENIEWTPPHYDISKPPSLAFESSDGENTVDFPRLARWSPDGCAVLAQYEHRSFRIHHLDLANQPELHSPTCFHQPSAILDFAWFPSATLKDPASFCFVASVRECPVKLLDGSDGRLRASYKIVDHRERQIAPHSLAFNATFDKLYCGFEDAVEVFDVASPGEGTRLRTTPSKKSRDGLKGIVSALAFSADASSGVFAAGTLSPSAPTSSNIALFTETTGEVPVMFVGAEDPGGREGFGVRASVTQLKFNPAQPYLLYASFRRQDTIYSWDLRGDVSKPVQTFSKPQDRAHALATNQKLHFDVDISGTVLGVGDHHGDISLFDLGTGAAGTALPTTSAEAQAQYIAPARTYAGHGDAVGSVAFNPITPLLLSVSGSRHFDEELPSPASSRSSSPASELDVRGSETEAASAACRTTSPIQMSRDGRRPRAKHASIKLWDFRRQEHSNSHPASQ